jgi:histidine triad (HIT) family protein
MESIFTKIIKGEISAFKIAESDDYMAFLDVFPLTAGHTLVIPKHQVDKIYELSPEAYQGLWAFTQKIAQAIESSFECKRVGISVIGLEVPHAHIHLVPINEIQDLNFSNTRLKFTQAEFEAIAQKISNRLK